MTLVPGTLLNNRYRIASVLGQGGMGAVYFATDEALDVPVAVKENLYLAEEYSRQFQREASILARLRHPNLPRVNDYFAMPGQGQYMIMDFIEGEDLRQRLERLITIPERDVILIGASICDALSYLHTRQPPIVHRDIKPGNIKITPESEVLLVDFGLVKEMQDNQATTTGARAMTPGYSPPEQYGSARTDARTDIYSLGATLYAALTGTIPEDSLSRATGKASLTQVKNLKPKVNARLAGVLERALALEPGQRYQTAEDLKRGLLAAGELTAHFQDRLKVTPPPLEPIPVEEAPIISQISGSQASSPPGRISTWLFRIFALVMILLIITLSVFIVPSLSNGRFSLPVLSRSTIDPSHQQSATPPFRFSETPTLSSPVEVFTLVQAGTEIIASTAYTSMTPMGGGASQIAFASDRSGINQVWLMNSDGTFQHQLTSLKDGACQPSWSPDGKRIAITSPCPGKRDLYQGSSIFLLNADGSDVRQMPIPPSPQGDFDPAWSPDGQRIAFTSLRDGIRSHIYLFKFSDSSFVKLTDSIYADKHPSWAPGGLQLAFVRMLPNSQVWIMSDSGQAAFQFSPNGAVNNLWPVWSGDGQVVYYSQLGVESNVPVLVGLSYENRTIGTEIHVPSWNSGELGPVSKPSNSSDSRWIVYESWPDGKNHDIYLASINGGNRLRLTTDRSLDYSPAWRP